MMITGCKRLTDKNDLSKLLKLSELDIVAKL